MSSLFDDAIPTVATNAALEILRAEHPDIDPYYLASASISERRQRFEALWEAFEPYADSYLLRRIKTNFHDCSWEMYVGAMLLAHGMSLEPPGDEGPDIRVKSPFKMAIEAIAVDPGTGADAVPEMIMGKVQDVPERQLLLRVTGGLGSKLEQHLGHLNSRIVSPELPFIIVTIP